MPRSSQRWDEEDDDYYPVYKGARNYESLGAKMGEAFSDLAVSVRRAAGNVLDDPAVSKQAAEAGKTWEKAKKAVFGEEEPDDDRRVASGLPANCFCDMRGFACPRHRGREKWRLAQDYKLHVKHNVEADGSSSETALGGGGKLAGATFGADVIQRAQDAAGIAARDADMAQLVQMGFDPDKVARALAKHKTLVAATNALLDDPDSAARDDTSGSQLPEPPSAPPPKPPGASFSDGAAASRGEPRVLGAPLGSSAGPFDLGGINLISLEEMDSPPAAAALPVPAAAARSAYADLDPMSARFPVQPAAPLRPPPGVMATAGGMPLMMSASPALPLEAPPPMQPPMLLQGFGGGSMRIGAVPHMDGHAPRGPPGYVPAVAPRGYHSGGHGPMGMPHGCLMGYPYGGGATVAGGLTVPHGGMGMPTPHASAIAPQLTAQMPGAPRLTPPSMAMAYVAPGGAVSAAPAYAPTGAVSGGCVSAASPPSVASLGSTPSTDEGSDGLPAWLSTAEANLSTLAAAAVPHPAAPASAPWQAALAASAVAPWMVVADPATARAYYYNTVTKESQWEPPSAAAADSDAPVVLRASAAAPPPAAAAGALPAGWQSGIDPKSGVVYYCNPSLNVTQWAHPAETTTR